MSLLKNIYNANKDNKSVIHALNLFFAALYFLISYASLKFATINSSVSPIWPSTGLAISIIILFGRRYTFSIFLGAFLVNLTTPTPFMNALIIAFGNAAEAFIGSFIYLKLDLYKKKFEHLSELINVTATSLLAPLISATVGVSSLTYFGLVQSGYHSQIWLTWWIADAIGAMLLIPIILRIKNKDLGRLALKFRLYPGRQFAIYLISFTILIIFYAVLVEATSLKFIFLLFPLLIFFTVNKNRFFTYFCSAVLCSMAIYITVSGKGPFNLSSLNQNLINLEIYIVAICITTLGLASLNHLKFIKHIRIVLVCGWLFCGSVFYFIQQNHETADSQAFRNSTLDIENRIKERMGDYLQVLASGRALFMASREVDTDGWRDFVNSLNISNTYKGMNGMGIVHRVSDDDLGSYLKMAQRKIDPNFVIKEVPAHLGELTVKAKNHFIITGIEPYGKNMSARGLDLGSESRRRKAAEKSILTGTSSLTERVRLIQDQKKRLGFLIFLPVFKNNFPINNPEERKIAFSHWVYAPFITEQFLDSVFEKVHNDSLVFEIYDHPDQQEAQIVYSNNRDNINSKAGSIFSKIKLGDKDFYIKWSRSKNHMVSHDFLSTWIGLIGTLMVLIVTLFIINVQLLEEKSNRIALGMHQLFLNAQVIVKEHEAKMIESRKMATLGEMASSIAHEINNPLTIISGNNQHLKRAIIESENFSDKEKMLNYIGKVENTVFRIEKIIKGLRLFSRDGTNDQMYSVSMDILLEETLALCHERFRTSNVLLKVHSSYREDLVCRGTEISQVLINLLNNAYDAVQELDEKWVELEVKQVNNYLQLIVKDSGKGIPKGIQEKILMPFFTTKEIGKGTGLGLSISKGIVESHGGSLSVDSHQLHTCFIVKLPLNQKNVIIKSVS